MGTQKPRQPEIIPIKGGGLATFGNMQRRPLDWIIPGLLPAGELVLSAGRSGVGKSTWLAGVVAHVTGGLRLQGGDDVFPATALLYGAEADPRGEQLDRLESAGAVLERCVCGDELPDGSPAPRPYLPEHLPSLRQRILACKAALVIIDPLTSYLSAGISPNDAQGVRHVLLALQALCRECFCTICIVAHNRKSAAGDCSDWISGTKEWWNTPRWILCHAADPATPHHYILAVGKHSRTGAQPSRAYRITPRPPAARLELLGVHSATADELGAPEEDTIERGCRVDARQYLRMALDEGERRAKDLLADGEANGVSRRTMRRAADDLGVSHHLLRVQGDVHWVWRAPPEWPAE